MRRLSPLDASFLHLERDAQALNVGSALIFEGPPPGLDELCRAIEALLPTFPRYRQRVKRVPLDLALPMWVDDPRFRLNGHVGSRTLPAPGSEDDLRRLAVALISEPLDLTRPLWRMWFVTGLQGGRFALVNTNHHAMIDGISGTDIIGALLSTSPAAPRQCVSPLPWKPDPEPTAARLTGQALLEVASTPVRTTTRLGRALRPRMVSRSAAQVVGMTHYGQQLLHLELGLNGPIGPRRDWEWVRADLDAVKAVKNRHGGTVNDVVLAAIAGGFRSLLQSRGQSVGGRTLRTMVPVSMRGVDDHDTLGNRVSAVFPDLPIGLADPLERLGAVSSQMAALKRGRTALGVDALLCAADLLPGSLIALAVKAWAHSPQRIFSTVTTNVPGPQQPLYLLGRRMTDLFPYIPLGADLRITIGIASYAGGLTWGITGDHGSVPDLPVLADGIDRSITELVNLSIPARPIEVRHA